MRDGQAIAARLGGKRVSGGWLFRCPAHDDRRPSCAIRDDGLVTCFAGCNRRHVEAALDALGLRDNGAAPTPLENDRPARLRAARAAWGQSWSVPADALRLYLRRRCIALPTPDVLHWSKHGMVSAVQAPDGNITAVQIKPRSRDEDRPPHTIGVLGSGAVRLSPLNCVRTELGIAEGVETALSAMQLTGVPVWASLSAFRLRSVWIPSRVAELHIFADNDTAGRTAAERAADAHSRAGRIVHVRTPPEPHGDYNDFLVAMKKESAA